MGNAIMEYEVRTRTKRIDHLVIPLYGPQALNYPLDDLARTLENLIAETLTQRVTVTFRPRRFQARVTPESTNATPPTIALFSGGVDSYAGILATQSQRESVRGVYCAHRDQSHGIRIVRQLAERLTQRENISIVEVPVPALQATGYVQLRGFGYVLAAGYEALNDGADTIVISECGPTMFQPRFGPFDAVTMTTHPRIMHAAQHALSLLAGRPIRLRMPFRHLTKAEVMTVTPTKDFRQTHSCISQRFGTHDGTCYGCVIRHLAAIAADARDVHYERDPIADPTSHAGNLLSLLVFNQDFLTRYDDLPTFQKDPIEAYGTQNLFKRFALDNYAALHALKTRHRRMQETVRHLYDDTVARIGTARLEERLFTLRRPGIKAPQLESSGADLPTPTASDERADCA
jgi:7-cyano-7-deazaguanine synthase in queuosine biosynthesis